MTDSLRLPPLSAVPSAPTAGAPRASAGPISRDRVTLGDHVQLVVSRPADIFRHPSVLEPQPTTVRLHVPADQQPVSARPEATPSGPAFIEALAGAPGLVRREGEEVYGTLSAVLSSRQDDLDRLADLADCVRTPGCGNRHDSALGLCGSAARSRVSPYPGDVDFFETLVVRASDSAMADRHVAACLVASAKRAQARGMVLSAIQVEGAKYLPGPDGIYKQKGWDGTPLKVSAGLDEHLLRDLAKELCDREHDFIKLDFLAPVEGRYRDVTKNVRYAVQDEATGRLEVRFPETSAVAETLFEEAYASPEEAIVAARVSAVACPGGMGNPKALAKYVGMLEKQVKHYATVGKNPLKVANRLYSRYAALGLWPRANSVAGIFARGPARVWQAASEMDALARGLKRGLPLDREIVTRQVGAFVDRIADASPELAEASEPSLRAAHAALGNLEDARAAKLLEGVRKSLLEAAGREVEAYLQTRPEVQQDLAGLLTRPA